MRTRRVHRVLPGDRVSIPRRGNEDRACRVPGPAHSRFQSLVGAMRTDRQVSKKVLAERFQSLVGAMRTCSGVPHHRRRQPDVSIPRRGNEDTRAVLLTPDGISVFQSLVGAMRTGRVPVLHPVRKPVSIPRRGNEDRAVPAFQQRRLHVSIPRRGNEDYGEVNLPAIATLLFQSLVGAMRTGSHQPQDAARPEGFNPS